jgi:hypothetical protein
VHIRLQSHGFRLEAGMVGRKLRQVAAFLESFFSGNQEIVKARQNGVRRFPSDIPRRRESFASFWSKVIAGDSVWGRCSLKLL